MCVEDIAVTEMRERWEEASDNDDELTDVIYKSIQENVLTALEVLHGYLGDDIE